MNVMRMSLDSMSSLLSFQTFFHSFFYFVFLRFHSMFLLPIYIFNIRLTQSNIIFIRLFSAHILMKLNLFVFFFQFCCHLLFPISFFSFTKHTYMSVANQDITSRGVIVMMPMNIFISLHTTSI